MPHLQAQMDFLITCDRLKSVVRTTWLHDGSRAENSAEHSWHLAVMAMTLGEYAPPGTQLGRVVELLVIHDLVEIYAGDTHFDQSDTQRSMQMVKEAEAATQLFTLLPEDQREHFLSLWQEFEAQHTPEARFAKALDALHPMLLTWGTGGQGSVTHPELTLQRVLGLKERALRPFPALWEYAQQMLGRAVQDGLLPSELETVSPT